MEKGRFHSNKTHGQTDWHATNHTVSYKTFTLKQTDITIDKLWHWSITFPLDASKESLGTHWPDATLSRKRTNTNGYSRTLTNDPRICDDLHIRFQVFQVLYILLAHMGMRDNKQYIEHIYKEKNKIHVKCNKLTAKTNAKYTQLTIEKDDKHTYS